jgi:hypothetical protein
LNATWAVDDPEEGGVSHVGMRLKNAMTYGAGDRR